MSALTRDGDALGFGATGIGGSAGSGATKGVGSGAAGAGGAAAEGATGAAAGAKGGATATGATGASSGSFLTIYFLGFLPSPLVL